MMDWTDRHCRYFHRLLSPHVRLYTEMVTASAVIHGDRERLLGFDPAEHPVALQLGGSDPVEMAEAAAIAADMGYDEININVGCPSDRVQSGRFGACLMLTPRVVADCVRQMRRSVKVPVTVKSRIGVDGREDYEFLRDFVGPVAEAGCEVLLVHARIAVLEGLNPKQNREVPPLRYETVYRLKEDFPQLTIVLNGGVRTIEAVRHHLDRADGVMIGREAYQNPWFLTRIEETVFSGQPPVSRLAVAEAMTDYARSQLSKGVRLHSITRHMLGLFAGQPGARAWRRTLSEQAPRAGAGVHVIEAAMDNIRDAMALEGTAT
jgi:tRNA-dihydrouridine synthase A